MTHNPYVPISQTPWWCVNGHYNAHEREICRYCDVPFTADQRGNAPDVSPPAADSRDTAAPRRHHAPHAKRYAMRFQDDCWGMDEVPGGSYVRFDDYEALRRQYDATADYYRDGLSYKGTERCLRCGFWKGCGCLCAPQEMSDTAASVPEDHDG